MKEKQFYAAMYLRLSRDDEDRDGQIKSESNSIRSQRELIKSFIREQEDIELYDSYVDDGFTGSNFDRPDFIRMMEDVEAGRVNCVIVKDLSRFGRDYIESGRYIQKVFPSLGVRFIAVTDHYDSLSADSGESNIVLPVKNFINDSYCRDISTKVKSQLNIKRKNGEYIAPFAVYGYRKAENNRNQLVIDEYAADIVRKIFEWKIEGYALTAIADRLNERGVLSPREYKKSLGMNFEGGFKGPEQSKWGAVAVKRILQNEVYIGNLVQGKTEKVNYKVKKCIEKAEADWDRVENTHEPIIYPEQFQVVQNLLQSDGRKNQDEINPYVGILFCADCKEQVVRRVNRYKNSKRVYYICSTKNRGEGCSRHSIEEETLKEIVESTIRKYAFRFIEQEQIFEGVKGNDVDFESIAGYDKEIIRLKQEQDKYYQLCSGLYEDLKQGVITKEEFAKLQDEFEKKSNEVEVALHKQEELIKDIFQKGVLTVGRLKSFQNSLELEDIDRHTLCMLVKKIWIYENKRIEIEFYSSDRAEIMFNTNQMLHQKLTEV